MKSIPATLMFLALKRRAYEERIRAVEQASVELADILTRDDLKAGEIVDHLPSAIGTAGVTDFSARPNEELSSSPHLSSDASTTPLPQHPSAAFPDCAAGGLLSPLAEMDKQIAVTRGIVEMMREMNQKKP